MYTASFPVIASVLFATSAHSHIILDQQCWHEYPLSQVDIQSSLDSKLEIVSKLSLSNIAEEQNHAPWSQPPICTHALEGIDDKLCIYTSRSFSNGRGISMFTTPSLAAEFASLPAFTDQSASAAQKINVNTGTWRAESIPSKGIGMIANRPLVFKDRITAYTPAFLAYLESELGTLEREKWWRLAIEQLPENTKNDFLGLATVYGDERVRVQDIVKANTFQVEVGGGNHLAIFPETSRLNHACNANAQYIIDTDTLSHTVHATRPIAEGEEITISYTSPLDPLTIRKQNLQSGFHFTCTCSRCTSPESDETLAQIASMQSELNDWSEDSVGSPETAELLLRVYREEGLEGFMDVPYGFAALAYNAVGDDVKAIKYAKKAKEAVLMKDGRWSANLRIWEEMLADVRGHWSWRRRL